MNGLWMLQKKSLFGGLRLRCEVTDFVILIALRMNTKEMMTSDNSDGGIVRNCE